MIRFLLLLLISLQLHLTAASDISNFSKYKKEYFGAILNGNTNKEINSLKKLIYYGKRLNKPILKYKKELKLLNNKTASKNKVVKKPQYTKRTYSKEISTDTLKDIKVVDNTIVIEFKHKAQKRHIKFSERRYRGLSRDNFDIIAKLSNVNDMKLSMPIVKAIQKIVIYQNGKNKIRISLRGKKNLKTVYIIGDKKIIIKVLEKTKKVKQYMQANLKSKIFTKTIVIDPGHGGKDPGARGPKGRYEKVSVLKIASKLASTLRARGYKVYMTRSGDRYRSLKYRTKYANKKKADLFISLHANAVPKRKAYKVKGIETYYLSPARSARAKRVAALENQADLKSMAYSSKNIFLMTQNRAKITASNKLALDVQNNLLYKLKSKYRDIKDNGVRKGPFWILVGAQMPSILVEIGYISHPVESKRLYSSSYQSLLATGIANGVDSYFIKNQ